MYVIYFWYGSYVLHVANNQFSDNFNNGGGGLLSSMLLYLQKKYMWEKFDIVCVT